jgi:hypothetical protein
VDAILAQILDSASRAPSAHNTQPWLLRLRGQSLQICLNAERRLTAVDPTDADALHALGALLENVILTLWQLSFEPDYQCRDVLSCQEPVVTVTWRPGNSSSNPTLYRMIPIRRTSRLPYIDEPLSALDIHALQSAVTSPCQLTVLTDDPAIQNVRRLVTVATAEQLADQPIASELYRWLRFSSSDSNWSRDGLNAACMNWRWWEAASARWLLSPRMLRCLKIFGLHRALCASVDSQAPSAPALCLLTFDGHGVQQRIDAGRILQRIWLTAAARGLVTHPLSAGLDVVSTRPKVLAQFGLSAAQPYVNLFRIGKSAHPARSCRLPVDEIVSY